MTLRHRAAGAACVIAVAWVGTALAALPQTAPIDPYGRIIACLKACKQNSPPVLNCARSCMPTSVPTPPAPPIGAPSGSLYVVTLGDSIIWGQGIPEGQKFPDLVTNWLQTLYGSSYYVTRFPTRAHSGAPLQASGDGPNVAPGEIPENVPSVPLQVELTLADLANAGVPPASVILVLVDGCINDVSATTIVVGVNSSNDIANWTNQHCAGMRQLLQRVGAVFPKAAVVVTGYYQIITSSTDPAALPALLAVGGAAAGGPWGGILGAAAGVLDTGRAQANSLAFATAAQNVLATEVQIANGDPNLVPAGAPPRFALAWPNFTADNGYAAPSTWVWKVEEFLPAETLGSLVSLPSVFGISIPFPFDPNSADAVAYYRAQWCVSNGDLISTCIDASVGHPNFLGVSAYTQAVIQQIETTLHARFPPPTLVPGTPPGVVVRVQTGSDTAGPIVTFAGVPTKLTHWLWVSVFNPHTGARIDHTPIGVRPSMPQQQASGQGESFAKFYYLCKPLLIPPLRNSLAPPPPLIKTCAGTVSATGFPVAYFSAPADPL
jgi:hypothetical protein